MALRFRISQLTVELGQLSHHLGVRFTIHTGLPRHSAVIFSPGLRLEITDCP